MIHWPKPLARSCLLFLRVCLFFILLSFFLVWCVCSLYIFFLLFCSLIWSFLLALWFTSSEIILKSFRFYPFTSSVPIQFTKSFLIHTSAKINKYNLSRTTNGKKVYINEFICMKINSRVYYVLLAHPTEYKRRERNKEKKTLRIKETLCTLAKDERNARTKKKTIKPMQWQINQSVKKNILVSIERREEQKKNQTGNICTQSLTLTLCFMLHRQPHCCICDSSCQNAYIRIDLLNIL